MKTLKVGIIGYRGVISSFYMKNLNKKFRNIQVTACADMIDEKAPLCLRNLAYRNTARWMNYFVILK